MDKKTHKSKEVFVEGAVQVQFIADSIAKHAVKTNIGAHDIFLGQVRADAHENGVVSAIEYTAYREMAQRVFDDIRECTFEKFPLVCMHIYHSLGVVPAGGISLFVFTSAIHRQAAFDACRYVVERIKHDAPVWGKELLMEGGSKWKQNSEA